MESRFPELKDSPVFQNLFVLLGTKAWQNESWWYEVTDAGWSF